MVKLSDFVKPDGSWDSKAYHAACVAAGETCMTCGGSILFPKKGPAQCNACWAFERENQEVLHDSQVRCPACGHHWRVDTDDETDLYEEGSHTTTCPECDQHFDVSTSITYTFESPPKSEPPPKEDEREERGA